MIIDKIKTTLVVPNNNDYLTLYVTSDQVVMWCLGLCALQKGVINSIQLLGPSQRALGIILNSSDERNNFSAKDYRKIYISRQSLDYWIGFILRYAYNNIAEVDHIDIDAGLVGDANQDKSIILKFDSSLSPMSSDEMNKLLESM